MSEVKSHFYLVAEPFGREITKRVRRKHIIYITDKGTEMRVVMMCWVPSSIADIVGFAKYSECDGTFKCCRPYTTFCLHGITNNVGIPMCLGFAPSEREVSYSFCYSCICQTLKDKNREDMIKKNYVNASAK